ncbi:lysophospholipid acyltransferase family protein [Candidatus Phytoplasma ziziphi]|uniref:lysophospholipid acyltransferase family protein n=1 Tax=Candidatus Phytoplasma TaxID=33926 RepID=UPI001EE0B72E|nr:lysophospholipid acyltransferase family protein [Candidatus Phytoplasma ziziphi]
MICWGVLGFFISIILAWICILFFLFIAMWFSKRFKVDHPFRQKIISSMSKLIIRFFRIKIIVHNKHLIPLQDKLIIYSNHKTNFDPFIIASIFPRTISFTPKDELYRGKMGWLLSYYFNAANCIKITRGNNKETIKNVLKGIDNIKKNMAMVVFHEGGIIHKTSDKIVSSSDGSFKIAVRSQSNILPITLKGSCAMRGKCWFKRKKVDVVIHEPINYENFKNKNTQEINREVTKIINSVL